jgi:hypothetical protein
MNLGQLIGELKYGKIERVRPSALVADATTLASQADILERHREDAEAARAAVLRGMVDDDEAEVVRHPAVPRQALRSPARKRRGHVRDRVLEVLAEAGRYLSLKQVCALVPEHKQVTVGTVLYSSKYVTRIGDRGDYRFAIDKAQRA